MHVDEIHTDTALVRRLLSAQFPQWADLPIAPVSSASTDNALYRLGTDKVVRLPRIHWAIGQVGKEHQWLPRLAPQLPPAIPVALAKGAPRTGIVQFNEIVKMITNGRFDLMYHLDAEVNYESDNEFAGKGLPVRES